MVRSVQPNARATCLLSLAANDKVENLPLARRQCRHMSANHIQLALQGSRHFMMRDRPLDRPKQIIRRYWLGQNVSRTRLDGLYRDWNIEIASEENDWQRRTESARRFCSAGPSKPGIRTSRRMQLGMLSVGKLTSKCRAEG